jgi:hypothetical protein
MNEALTSFGVMPPVHDFVSKKGEVDPTRLEDALYERILANALKKSPEEFRADAYHIREVIAQGRGSRGIHFQLVRAVIPAAPRGRNKKIARDQLPALAKLSEQLLPVITIFLEIQKHAPKTSTSRTLEYLQGQYERPLFNTCLNGVHF